MATLFIPGQGNVDLDVYKVHLAVGQYDERLSFKQHPETGDWAVWVSTPRPHSEWNPPEIPVLGFGREIPSVETALKRLYESDTKRHGTEILRALDRRNTEREKAGKDQYAVALENTAEHVEFGMRKDGKSPVVKSLPAKPRG